MLDHQRRWGWKGRVSPPSTRFCWREVAGAGTVVPSLGIRAAAFGGGDRSRPASRFGPVARLNESPDPGGRRVDDLGDQSVEELGLVEEQVEIVLLPADLELGLATEEGEARAEIEEKVAGVDDERLVDLPLGGIRAEREEVEDMRVLDHLPCEASIVI